MLAVMRREAALSMPGSDEVTSGLPQALVIIGVVFLLVPLVGGSDLARAPDQFKVIARVAEVRPFSRIGPSLLLPGRLAFRGRKNITNRGLIPLISWVEKQ